MMIDLLHGRKRGKERRQALSELWKYVRIVTVISTVSLDGGECL